MYKSIFLISIWILALTTSGNLNAHQMLPTTGADPGYQVSTTNSGKRTALTGKGREINSYIANKISTARSGDTIRINMYIIEHTYTGTGYFYNALATALSNGASIEIVTEANNTNANLVSEGLYRNSCEFLYGYPSSNCAVFPNSTPPASPPGLINETIGVGGSINIYKCSQGCDSTSSSAINHNKVTLLDIDGERDIIVTSANIRHGGEDDWQVGVDLDGNHYFSQWAWWNSVIDADICFAQGGGGQLRCGGWWI